MTLEDVQLLGCLVKCSLEIWLSCCIHNLIMNSVKSEPNYETRKKRK